MSVYPLKIKQFLADASHAGPIGEPDAAGTEVSFDCGTYAAMMLCIDRETSVIEAARFGTNGCGFAVASCEVLSRHVERRRLQDLHGTDGGELGSFLESELGILPAGRSHCTELAVGSLRAALAAYRKSLVDEYRGEKALICSCFGIGEDTIVDCIRDNGFTEVTDVTKLCRAGGGCGSCRPLIQELIDANGHNSDVL